MNATRQRNLASRPGANDRAVSTIPKGFPSRKREIMNVLLDAMRSRGFAELMVGGPSLFDLAEAARSVVTGDYQKSALAKGLAGLGGPRTELHDVLTIPLKRAFPALRDDPLARRARIVTVPLHDWMESLSLTHELGPYVRSYMPGEWWMEGVPFLERGRVLCLPNDAGEDRIISMFALDAESEGFTPLTPVWVSEFRGTPQSVIEKCKKWLTGSGPSCRNNECDPRCPVPCESGFYFQEGRYTFRCWCP
jgi:hypothetical protein